MLSARVRERCPILVSQVDTKMGKATARARAVNIAFFLDRRNNLDREKVPR